MHDRSSLFLIASNAPPCPFMVLLSSPRPQAVRKVQPCLPTLVNNPLEDKKVNTKKLVVWRLRPLRSKVMTVVNRNKIGRTDVNAQWFGQEKEIVVKSRRASP